MRLNLDLNQNIPDDIKALAMRGLRKGAENLLTETIKDTPKEKGVLIQSGHTDFEEATLRASVYFNTPYAVRLHEHPEYNFQNGRRGKYLELAVEENRDATMRIIADEIKKGMV